MNNFVESGGGDDGPVGHGSLCTTVISVKDSGWVSIHTLILYVPQAFSRKSKVTRALPRLLVTSGQDTVAVPLFGLTLHATVVFAREGYTGAVTVTPGQPLGTCTVVAPNGIEKQINSRKMKPISCFLIGMLDI